MEILADQIKGDRQNKHSFVSRMLTALSFVSALMLGIVSGAQAADVTEITSCPHNISSPGPYRLVVDCVVVNGSGIAITAGTRDVELDLDGHTISGPGCDVSALGINVSGATNVRITNGTLRNLGWGIQATGSDHNVFSYLTLVENCIGMA
jgi:hypothetical protein